MRTEYEYVDENGDLRFVVERIESNGTKKFIQKRPDGNGGWIHNVDGVPNLPYRADKVSTALDDGTPVYIVEGEKCVHALESLGLVATTNRGGAGKWDERWGAWWAGSPAIILPDNDEPGRLHAENVADSMRGNAAGIKVVELPGLPDKGDVADWIESGGTKDELLKIVAATPEHDFESTTWDVIDLTDAFAGVGVEPPAMWERSDGEHFIYSSRVHWFQGEPESCKTLAAQVIAADEIKAGRDVLYVDFEDDEHGLVDRLKSLGVTAEQRRHIVYVRPDEPLEGDAEADFARVLGGRTFSLAIVDGVTEAMTLQGLEIISNSDVAEWIRMLPKRVSRLAGAAVICIDHVTKSKDDRGRFAIGGQHKLAGTTGAAYGFTLVQPLYRPLGAEPVLGIVDVTIVKDRPAYLRRTAMADKAGSLHFEAFPDGVISARFVPPSESGPARQLVTGILEHLSDYDGSTKNQIISEVDGKTDRKREAIKWMAAPERAWLRIEKVGQTHRHYLTATGREELARRKP